MENSGLQIMTTHCTVLVVIKDLYLSLSLNPGPNGISTSFHSVPSAKEAEYNGDVVL